MSYEKCVRSQILAGLAWLLAVSGSTNLAMSQDSLGQLDLNRSVGIGGANDVVLSPDGEHLYALAPDYDGLVVMAIDDSAGTLSVIESFVAGQDVSSGLVSSRALAISPDGLHLYVATQLVTSAKAIVIFSRNPGTGQLTHVDTVLGLGSSHDLLSVLVSPDGDHVYAGNNSGTIFMFMRGSVDGSLTSIGSVIDDEQGVNNLSGTTRLVASADGEFVYASSRFDHAVTVFTRNAQSGVLTFLEDHVDGSAGIDTLERVVHIALSPDGLNLYALAATDDAITVFQRNTSTGSLAVIQTLEASTPGFEDLFNPVAIAISSDGLNAYVSTGVDGGGIARLRRAADGQLTLVQTVSEDAGLADNLSGAAGMAVTQNDSYIAVANNRADSISLLERHPVSFELSLVFNERGGFGNVRGLNGVSDVAVSGDGQYAYAAASDDSSLMVFERSGGGLLSPIARLVDDTAGVDGLRGASALALSPAEDTVYVAGRAESAIGIFDRNAGSGLLSFVEEFVSGDLSGVSDIVVSPDANNVYAVAFVGRLVAFDRDPVTGGLSELQVFTDDETTGIPELVVAEAVAISPDGLQVYTTSSSASAMVVFDRQSADGMLSLHSVVVDGVGGVEGIGGAEGIAVSADNRFIYVAGPFQDRSIGVFERNLITGDISWIDQFTDFNGLASAYALALSPDGEHLLVASASDNNALSLIERNPVTGLLSNITTVFDGVDGVDGLHDPRSVAVSPDGRHIYVASRGDDSVASFVFDGIFSDSFEN